MHIKALLHNQACPLLVFGDLRMSLAACQSLSGHLVSRISVGMQAEQAVQAEKFPATSIFRPGKLDRGAKANTMERLGAVLPITSTPVRDVAKAMVLDAAANQNGLHIYDEAAILQCAKLGILP